MPKEKQYLRGGAKKVDFGNKGYVINIGLFKEQLDELFEGEEWINISITPRKGGKDKYGNTHTIYVNDFKPDRSSAQEEDDTPPTDELPFD